MIRDCEDTPLGAAAIPIYIATETAGGFGPLKAALGAIPAACANHEVRILPPPKVFLLLNHLQETVIINKIQNLLSRIAVLEALFSTRPVDVDDQRRRSELIRYAAPPHQTRY